MVELLAVLGVTSAWTFVFKPIIEELAKESTKDWANDFCKDSLKHVLGTKDEWSRAAGKAVKEFLEQFEQELIGAGETEETSERYLESLRRFTRHRGTRLLLGQAITDPESPVDWGTLARLWTEIGLQRLPDDFDWAKLCRRYQNKARGILRDSKELRSILDSQYQESIAEAVQRMAGIAPGSDTSKYADGLRKRYGYLKLESLDPSPDHRQIALTRIFVEQTVRSCQHFNPRVYELPIEYRRRLREQDGLDRELEEAEIERQRDCFLQQSPSPVLGVVNDPRQRLCVVLGDPGSGKSVLLDYLALQWAELPPVDRAMRPLPLLIDLKTYAENLAKGTCRDFLEYLDHGSGTVAKLDQKELDTLLQRGQAALLFDGLDEIFDAPTRLQVSQDIVRFTTCYGGARFLVTSRNIGYDELAGPILRGAGFLHFMLQDLDEDQQDRFIHRWHDLAYADPAERTEKSGRLRTSITSVVAIHELAQNPLLLTLMALLNRHQELPHDRNELYEQASRLMLQQWDASKALRDDPLLAQQGFDYKDKQAMLREVALRMQTSPQGLAGNVIAADDLEQTLVDWLQVRGSKEPRPIAKRLIQQLRERNFILCLLGGDYFAFVHRTFLEFFSAWAWVWRFEKQKTITFDELQCQTFDAHWPDEKWHEVLRLIAARLEPQFAGRLIEGLLAKNDPSHRCMPVFLAAKCFSDIRNVGSLALVSGHLEQNLKDLVYFQLPFVPETWVEEQLERNVLAEAVRALAMCWPQQLPTQTWLKDIVDRDDNWTVCEAAVQALARGWKDDPDTLLWVKGLVRRQQDSWGNTTAVQELARGWRDDPDTLQFLKDLVRSDDEEPFVRMEALRELARGWKDGPDTLPIIKELLRSGEEDWLARVAVQELAQGWKADPDTLPILKDLVFTHEYSNYRAAYEEAVEQVADKWKHDPDTLPWLKDLVRNNQSGWVRSAAVQELARGWEDDPDTLPVLKDIARNDEDGWVRSAAVRGLSRGWKDDPDTLQILKDRAYNDEDGWVRSAAVQELGGTWKDDPDTLPILKAYARRDKYEYVRQGALRELARGWMGDADVLSIFKDVARQDKAFGVRQVVVRELARVWKDDPETLSILKDRASCDKSEWVRREAVEALGRVWKEDPETSEILKDHARSDKSEGVRKTAVRALAWGWKNEPDVQQFLGELSRGRGKRKRK